MDLGSIFLILALLVLVALFISRPFFEPQEPVRDKADHLDHERSTLLAERDRVLTLLRELEFDHAMGKTSEDDFAHRRIALVEEGAYILREMEALQSGVDDGELETQIEAAIAARRAGGSATAPNQALEAPSPNSINHGAARGFSPAITSPDDDLEVMIASRRRARREKSAGFCPKCGGPVQKSDHFCPKCGADIS